MRFGLLKNFSKKPATKRRGFLSSLRMEFFGSRGVQSQASKNEFFSWIKLFLLSFMIFGLLSGFAWGMGELPGTPESLEPAVSYDSSIGLPGSGDRQFFSPQDVKATLLGDLSTDLGDIFIADSGNNRIQRLSPSGGFVYQFGGFGNEPGKLNSPSGLAIDFNYRLYVAERDNDRVQLFDVRGNYLGLVATGEYEYKTIRDPAGLELDSLGNLYLADSGNDRVLKFDDSGKLLQIIGGYGVGAGFLNQPADLALDRDRYLYVADTGNNRIQKFDFDGRPLLSFTAAGAKPLYRPRGITVDDKMIYVADTENDRIVLFNKRGDFLLSFGESGAGPGQFKRPVGLSLGRAGRLFVADSGNNRIQVLKVTY